MVKSPQYRPDVDGLRAIAVTVVLLFHGYPSRVTGGFIGVDIFFVISGFLISGVILKDLRRNSFSYIGFYARRVRRIFPALTVVLAGCLALGWAICFPKEWRALGKHVIAGAGFISNLALWREAGYFDAASEAKPLLHLWSLGVEEQFYIAWPFLLALIYRKGRYRFTAIGTFAVGSFILNVLLIKGHANATFYLPFTRFWELLIGALLAWLFTSDETGRPLWKSDGIANLASWIGLGMLLVAIGCQDQRTPFPGWAALLPTLGTALVISAGPTAWLNRRLLAHPAAAYIGAISYPLYLWHWPLLTAARWTDLGSGFATGGVLLASVLLACLTYHFLETPVRFGRFKHKSPAYLVLALTVVTSGAAVVYGTRWRNARLAHTLGPSWMEQLSNLDTPVYPPCAGELAQIKSPRDLSIDWCMQSSAAAPVAAIFGDSHARALFSGVAAVDTKYSWALVGHNSCPPVNGIIVEGFVANCRERTEMMTAQLARTASVRTVVLTFFGNYFLDTDVAADHLANHFGPSTVKILDADGRSGNRQEIFFRGIDHTVDLLEASGKRVIIVIDVPELPFFPINKIRTHPAGLLAKAASIPRQSVLGRQESLRAGIERLRKAHPRLGVYDSLQVLCDATACYAIRDGLLLYADSHHLSYGGSVVFARQLLASITQHQSQFGARSVSSPGPLRAAAPLPVLISPAARYFFHSSE